MTRPRPRSVVVLTGAGISKESGLDTFRDADGLWAKVELEDVATPDAWRRDPAFVLEFHNGLRRGLAAVAPNPAHLALARLEREWPGELLVVTQNVDDLHERAGTRNLVHMHGELLKARCEACGAIAPCDADLSVRSACAACGLVGAMRPHVVWFYEAPLQMERIAEALERCDLFVSIGTSGNVYPAAGFVADVRARGRAHTLELNLEPSEGGAMFAERIHGPASRIVPHWAEALLRGV